MKQIGLIFCLLFSGALLWGQTASKKDLKIGLVLSGGGAKGMAHIGALKVIEEAGIQIDYIGGTSMGAIVGSLYAAGYSAVELDSVFRTTNFTNLIEDNLPRNAKTFYEKEDSERYSITLPFNNFKVSVPPALSGGQNVYNELVRLLYPVKDIDDFSKLPIPFLCIATDVETGKEVLLNSGYLPEAVMASGALPSLFSPALIDDQVLVDGGVVNNYPIAEVKKMGADIIIGVDVQHGLKDREALLSATEILLQINNYRTALDMEEKSQLTDVYIKPDITDFSVIDFNLFETIIGKGEEAAREKFEELKKLAEPGGRKEFHVKMYKPEDQLDVDRLTITGSDNYSRGYVKGKLRFEPDESPTFNELKQGVSNLSATGNFQTIHYNLLTNDSEQELTIKLVENKNKTFLRLGAHYDNLFKTGAIINLTRKNLVTRDDVTSFDFIIGDNIRYNLQYYVDKGSYWSFGINSSFKETAKEIDFELIRGNYEVPITGNLNTINLDITDFTNQVYVETVLREEFAFRLGMEHKLLKLSTRTLGVNNDMENPDSFRVQDGRTFFEKSDFYSVFGGLRLDTYDDRYFPSKGVYFDGDFHLYLFSLDFNKNFKEFSVAQAKVGTAFPIFGPLTLNIETEGGFKLGTSNVTSFDFVLGGYGSIQVNNLIPFFGYDFISLPGNSFVKSTGRLDLEFAPNNHLMFTANFANVDDDLFRTGEWFTLPDYSGYGVGYGWESFLGPLQVHYSWSPEGKNSNFFFSLGYWF
ncbi:patatin-like phospholipase family protein [Cytophaga sp. FL35]|uniref:patatin-like phospholipase family protein n=1 Tax=Cytophaga sp. FL35 TaxID=1904456 RepID=UPI001653E172|nr:patatin-like phospholipase family protein [Cytophaga sp. FL35]MBC6997743.1 patatin-like phospholipase family protein [Cytophaga sp. FL35]